MNKLGYFEIIQGHNAPRSRKIGDRDKLEQDIYLHKGDAFPEKFINQFNEAHEVLPVGLYSLCPTSFKANQYGGLELNKWEKKFISVEQKHVQKVS